MKFLHETDGTDTKFLNAGKMRKREVHFIFERKKHKKSDSQTIVTSYYGWNGIG